MGLNRIQLVKNNTHTKKKERLNVVLEWSCPVTVSNNLYLANNIPCGFDRSSNFAEIKMLVLS